MKITVHVECLVFGYAKGSLSVLLVERNEEPFKGNISLPGVSLNTNEDINDAYQRALQELTGLKNIRMEQLQTYSSSYREPDNHVVSIVFYALINIYHKRNNLIWQPLSDIPPLAFNHNTIVKEGYKKLLKKVGYMPIIFDLMPDKFTLRELQRVYEGLYNRKLDKRNFRNKIAKCPALLGLDEKKTDSKYRPPQLFRLDLEVFNSQGRGMFSLYG